MSYERKKWTFPRSIEIEENHSGRYGAPGEKRKERKKPTPEEVKRINRINKTKRCRRKLRQYFIPGDLYVTLTYRKVERPGTMEQAKEDWRKLRRALAKEYRKQGTTFCWIRNIECGSRGAWHIHMAMKRIEDADRIIAKAWPHGKAVWQAMTSDGDFRKLAEYLTKTPDTDRSLIAADYDASRNMPLKAPRRTAIRWQGTWKAIRIPKGWRLDEDSIEEGVNLAGYRFRHYTLLRC